MVGADDDKQGFAVHDRRHWADGEAEGAADAAAPRADRPSYVRELEQRVAEAEARLREYISARKVEQSDLQALRERLQREHAQEISRARGRVVAEVLDLLEALDVARQNLQAAQLNVDRAQELLETSKLMLRHGQAPYLTVLESEAERAQAQTNLIQARFDVLAATASLKRAIGISPMRPLASVPGLTGRDAQ